MAIYHHFPSRDALLTMITDREFAKLLTHIQVHPLRGTLEERLVAVWRGMSIICLHYPAFSISSSRACAPGLASSPKTFGPTALRLWIRLRTCSLRRYRKVL
jgi:AcrR family transcriptional regulator